MRKFIGITLKGKTTIYECEVFVATPRPFGLHPGEELYIVVEPKQFFNSEWYSIFFQNSLQECREKSENMIRSEFERVLTKNGTSFTEDDVKRELSKIEVSLL